MNRADALFYSIAFYSYLAAFLGFILCVALRRENLGKAATVLTVIGALPHTVAFFLRWIAQGHVPLVNMFEYMGLMSWMVAIGLIYFIIRYRNFKIGVFIIPVPILMMIVASLLPADVNRQLMPALQSNWLAIHVTMAALGSGAFLIAFAASALLLLAPSKTDSGLGKSAWLNYTLFWIIVPLLTSLILSVIGIIPPAINAAADGHNHELAGAAMTVASLQLSDEPIFWGRLMIGLGIGMIVSSVLWPLVHRQTNRTKDTLFSGSKLFIILIFSLLISATIVAFLIDAEIITLTPRSYFKIFEMFGPTLMLSWALTPLIASLLVRPGGGWLARLDLSTSVFEEISHSAVAIGYPLYTFGALFAGAIWAEQAWGSWWTWDPKEVGAMIIWLFYTGYLHARYQRRWQGSPAAVLIVLGMIMVFVSFFGNYFFGGLHSFEVG